MVVVVGGGGGVFVGCLMSFAVFAVVGVVGVGVGVGVVAVDVVVFAFVVVDGVGTRCGCCWCCCCCCFPSFTTRIRRNILPFHCNFLIPFSGARENPPGMPQEPTEEEDGSPSNSWLTDYKSGMEYEVYSLPLLVECDSHLFGMKFNR